METIEIIRALNALIRLATSAGINLAEFNAMREESGGHLTDEQIQQLSDSADEMRSRL